MNWLLNGRSHSDNMNISLKGQMWVFSELYLFFVDNNSGSKYSLFFQPKALKYVSTLKFLSKIG